jgi:hypothetical protein
MTAVRLYATDHPALTISSRAKIEKQRNQMIADLGTGYAQSFEDYKYQSGVIAGLGSALSLIEEAEAELMEKNS